MKKNNSETMISPDVDFALAHEAMVLLGTPVVLTAGWLILWLISIDPPLMSWVLVLVGLFAIEMIDNHRFGHGLTTKVIVLRGIVNFVVALISIALSGILVIITGPPTPKGPFSFLVTALAFLVMISVARTAIHIMMLTTRFDMNDVIRWWRTDGERRRPQATGDGSVQ